MRARNTAFVLLVGLAFSLALLVTGCGKSGQGIIQMGRQKPLFEVLIACDLSQSMGGVDKVTTTEAEKKKVEEIGRKTREDYCSIIDATTERTHGKGLLTIYTFASSLKKVYRNQPGRPEDVWSSLDQNVILTPLSSESGTLVIPVLEEFTRIAKERPEQPFVVLILSDGKFNDLAEACLVDKATGKSPISKLADCDNIRLLFIGPVSDGSFRMKLEEHFGMFRPADQGGRLAISGDGDRAYAMQTLEDVIKKLREGSAQ